MNTLLDPIRQALSARSPRERRMLLIATLVLVGGAIVAVAEWSWHERERVRRALPEAQSSLTRMQEDAAELLRLQRSRAPETVPLAARAEAARAAAVSRGIELELEHTQNMIRVTGSGGFDRMTDWLASLQADQRLRPASVRIAADGEQTRFELILVPNSGQ
mgnify:CR=1 FL=1